MPSHGSHGEYTPPKVLHPDPDAVAVMEGVRFSDLNTFLKRMSRMCRRRIDWVRTIGATGLLLLGGAIGGAFGLFPFLAAHPTPSALDRHLYYGAVAGAAFLAVVCGGFRMVVKGEREDSIQALRDDFREWLKVYGETTGEGEPSA